MHYHHRRIEMVEACQDKTLGGRVWDASIVVADVLQSLLCNAMEQVQWVDADKLKRAYAALDMSNAHDWHELISGDQALIVLNRQAASIVIKTFTSPINVLDLGCGAGLTGIALSSMLQPSSRVLLTDLVDIMPLTHRNLEHNASQHVKCMPLDWSEAQQNMHAVSERWEQAYTRPFVKVDVVLAADVAYNSATHHLLIGTWRTLIHHGAWVLFAYKPRYPDMETVIFRLIRSNGWACIPLARHYGVHLFIVGSRPSVLKG
jgi:hypothetical protein